MHRAELEFWAEKCNGIAQKILSRKNLESVTGEVVEMLDLILVNEEMMRMIFRHPLGFLDFPIGSIFPTSHKMRLHLWHLGGAAITSSIHFHTADILSLVLSGTIRDEQFYLVHRGEESTHELQRVEYFPGGSRRVPIGTIGEPVCDRVQMTCRGGVYFVPRSVLHRSMVQPGEMTVTLMIPFNEDPSMFHHALADRRSTMPAEFRHEQDVAPPMLASLISQAKSTILKRID